MVYSLPNRDYSSITPEIGREGAGSYEIDTSRCRDEEISKGSGIPEQRNTGIPKGSYAGTGDSLSERASTGQKCPNTIWT